MHDSLVVKGGSSDGCQISVVIPTYKRTEQLERLLRSLLVSTVAELDIIVVDNGASDETKEVVAGHDGVRYVRAERNLGCNGARGLGARLARGSWILFIDDDNVVAPDMIGRLAEAGERFPEVGILGPVMYRYDSPGEVWCAGAELTRWGLLRHVREVRSQRFVTSSSELGELVYVDYFPNCFMVERRVLDSSVEFDAEAFPCHWSEVDFCLRARLAGFRVALVPDATDWHDVGYSGSLARTNPQYIVDQARARIVFRKRFKNHWTDWLEFCFIVFPISSIVYFYKLARSRQLYAGSKAYLRGTLAGIRAPVDGQVSSH